MSLNIRALLSSAFTLALLGFAAAPAKAEATGDPAITQAGMTIAGFDAEVARAHGFEVVTLPDGSLASVPADKAAAAEAGTYVPTVGVLSKEDSDGAVSANAYGQVVGDCGYSWVQLTPRGGGSASLTTGMSLVLDSGGPWDVHWWVDISDTAGDSTQYYSEGDGYFSSTGLAWSGKARSLNLTKGWANATVTVGSYTVTENGWVCFSYSPTASTTIT